MQSFEEGNDLMETNELLGETWRNFEKLKKRFSGEFKSLSAQKLQRLNTELRRILEEILGDSLK